MLIEKNRAPKIIDKIKNNSFKEKFSTFFLRIKYPPQIIKFRNIKKAKTPKLEEKNQKDNKKKRKIYYEYFFLLEIHSLYCLLNRLLKR